MTDFSFVDLRAVPQMMMEAANWFHDKWGVPESAYMNCMIEYICGKTELGWYLCLDGRKIIGGLGVIENDFHDHPELTPNICAVYTEKEYRNKGIAGRLLNMAVQELKSRGISPAYLVTDHIGFYERYGWQFHSMVQCEGEDHLSRMYVHY